MKLPTDAEILAAAAELGYGEDEVTPRNRAKFAKVAQKLQEHDALPDPSQPMFHHEQNTPAGLLVVEGWLTPHEPHTKGTAQ